MSNAVRSTVIFEDDYMLRNCGSITTTPDISLTELVANAWDAGAMNVSITIPEELGNEIIVEDDGIGMTDDEFQQRWMTLGYNRKKRQGDTVEFPDNVENYVRHAYGRNGVGRHGMLCFSESYTVETWKNGLCNKYSIATSTGNNPFSILNHTTFDKNGHGTKLTAFVRKRLPKIVEIMDVISVRYLYDPRFVVTVNNMTLDLSRHPGLFEETDITLENGVKFSLSVIDSTKTARKSQQHGLAFWVCGRLVGMPSWSINDVTFLDGRVKAAKRYTIVLKTDDLIDEVLPDWTGFKQTSIIKTTIPEIKRYVDGLLSRIMSDYIDEVRSDVIHQNLEQLFDLNVQAKREVSAFIEEITVKQPLVKEDFLQAAVEAIVNVERSRRGVELLSLLSKMDADSLEKLTVLLANWDIRDIVLVMDEIDKRMTVIEAIRRLQEDPGTDELHTLHPLVLNSRWLFGSEFDSPMFVSNVSLNTTLKTLFKDKEYDTAYISNPKRRPDIVVLNKSSIKAVCTDRIDNESGLMKPDQVLLVEIKRGGFEINDDEVSQARYYMRSIKRSGALHNSATIHAYVIGAIIGDVDCHNETDSGILDVVTYGHLVETASQKLFRLKQHLNSHYEKIGDESLVEKALRTSGIQQTLKDVKK